MTPRQASVLEAIRAHQEAHGHTPTYEEIAAAIGLKSRGNVARVIACLRSRGYVLPSKRRARSVAIVKPSHSMACPHCGGALSITVQQRSEAA